MGIALKVMAWVSGVLWWGAIGGVAGAQPLGIWELAASHEAPVEAQMAFAAGGVVVMSDEKTVVLGVRPDSGLVVWKRRLSGASGVWKVELGNGMGEGVLVANGTESLVAYRADVGQRVWELSLGCTAEGCKTRVLHASGGVILLGEGGVSEGTVTRIEAASGKVVWGAQVIRPREVAVAPGWVAFEEGQSPFDVVFVELVSGRELGRWDKERVVPGTALFVQRGMLVSVELRPADGGLARVVLVRPDGTVDTERFISRPAAFTTEPVLAAQTLKGIAIWTPEPGKERSFLTTMRLEAPWTARTESVPTVEAPLVTEGGLAFFTGRAKLSFVRFAEQLESVPLEGVSGEKPTALAGGRRVILVERRAKRPAILTLEPETGAVHGVGAESVGEVTGGVLEGDSLLLLSRAKSGTTLHRFGFVGWDEAVQKLRAARDRGQDIGSWLERLGRFVPLRDALEKAPPVVGSEGGLSPEDEALVGALREAAMRGELVESLEAMHTLLEQAVEARRPSLLGAFAELVLEFVLARGQAPREDGVVALQGLVKYAENQHQRIPLPRATLGVLVATAAFVGEALAGADLAQAMGDELAQRSRVELAQRALFLLRQSAGALKSETSRENLFAALRYFRHLELVLGRSGPKVKELLEGVPSEAATREVVGYLMQAEGNAGRSKLPREATCQLGCEALSDLCGDSAAGRLQACQETCLKSGAVRFSKAGRPVDEARWFCR